MAAKKTEFGKACRWNIHIMPTENQGFVVEVGCRRFAFENKNSLLRALRQYFDNPEEVEKEIAEKTGPGEEAQEVAQRAQVMEQGGQAMAERVRNTVNQCDPVEREVAEDRPYPDDSPDYDRD